MKRIRLLVMVAGVLSAASCATSPRKSAAPQTALVPDYDPLENGAAWSYSLTDAHGQSGLVVVKVVAQDGNKFTIDTGSGTEELDLADASLTEHNTGDVTLKTPFEKGATWQGGAGDGAKMWTILDTNVTVTVPAGVFKDCVVVEERSTTSRDVSYFCRAVGLTKFEFFPPAANNNDNTNTTPISVGVLRGYNNSRKPAF